MINELQEVEAYLKGDNIKKHECTFRMCFLLAKYYNLQGMEPIDIRQNIFGWANAHGIYIKHNVNDIIRMAMEDVAPLHSEDVYVNEEDIYEITRRFDTKNTRMCALGMLLYAKAYSDEEGKFTFNQADFAKWVGIQQPHVSEHFEELEAFKYIEKIYASGDQTFAWNGRIIGKKIKYRLKVPHENVGEYKIVNNNLQELYHKIFVDANKMG